MKYSKIQRKLRSTILDIIYAHGHISRVEIATLTGITPATVSSITADLIEEQVIYEVGESKHVDHRAGRRKILLSIQPAARFFIGSEISERQFTFALTDNLGHILQKKILPMTKEAILQNGLSLFITALQSFVEECIKPITAIGICLPGRYLNDAKISTNNQLWSKFHLQRIQEAFSIPIYFANNVNAMALSKRLFSKGKNKGNYAYFHFHRGMHLSYMYEGSIYGRGNPAVGEIGHTVVQVDGPLCECGKRGCLQTYASENWLLKKASLLWQESSASYLPTLVDSPEKLTLHHLFTAYDLGDRGVKRLLEQAITYLAQTVMNLGSLIDSEKIFIHSPLFLHTELAHLLLNKSSAPHQLLYGPKQEVIIEPYDDITGAIAGGALCVYSTFLEAEKHPTSS